ncbi:MAG: ECF-type riboflavin transporter substrate-binding protein [Clostridia bacterium]|nr:ECF-type riboflavin transporter substrate-binding protein [Clostridia bacterium]
MKKSPVKSIVAVGIGAALFFVLGRFVAIPSPVPNTNISIQYGLLGFMAVAFGPIEGLLIGFIGHALIDFSFGWGVWWSWVIASGVFGLLAGLAGKFFVNINDGAIGAKEIVKFNIGQVVSHLICWGLVAPVLDIVIYSEPVEKLFAQGLVSATANIVTTAIIGSLLIVAYAATKPKKGSLTQEK